MLAYLNVSQFKKNLKEISLSVTYGYTVTNTDGETVATIDNNFSGLFDIIDYPAYKKLSEYDKEKLLMNLVQFSMTPLDNRTENKYNSIIGYNGVDYLVWTKTDDPDKYQLSVCGKAALDSEDTIFTKEEFDKLLKYISTLKDGEYQASVAKDGKTKVK